MAKSDLGMVEMLYRQEAAKNSEDKEEPTALEVGQTFGKFLVSAEHAYDAGHKPWQVALEFNIKVRPDFPDDWDDFEIHCPVCGSLLFDTEDLYLQKARGVLDITAHDLKSRFPWILEVCRVGRSGGWLIVIIPWPESRERLEEISGQLPEIKELVDKRLTSFSSKKHWVKAMSDARDEYSIVTESKPWEL